MTINDFRQFTKFNPNLKVKTRNTNEKGILDKIIIHCTDAPSWTPEKLSNFFVDERAFPCCSYHYYVMNEDVYHMVGENIITYHAGNHNKSSIGVAIDFHATAFEKLHIKPTVQTMDSLVKLLSGLCIEFRILPTNILGHRESINILSGLSQHNTDHLRKVCPGLSIDMNLIRYQVIREIQSTLKLTVDGIFGPKTKAALL